MMFGRDYDYSVGSAAEPPIRLQRGLKAFDLLASDEEDYESGAARGEVFAKLGGRKRRAARIQEPGPLEYEIRVVERTPVQARHREAHPQRGRDQEPYEDQTPFSGAHLSFAADSFPEPFSKLAHFPCSTAVVRRDRRYVSLRYTPALMLRGMNRQSGFRIAAVQALLLVGGCVLVGAQAPLHEMDLADTHHGSHDPTTPFHDHPMLLVVSIILIALSATFRRHACAAAVLPVGSHLRASAGLSRCDNDVGLYLFFSTFRI